MAVRTARITSTLTVTLALALQAQAGFAQTRPLPPGTQEMAENVAQAMLQVRDDDAELFCAKAVENAHGGLDTMLEVGRKNMDDGYLRRADFEATAKTLTELRGQLSVGDCQTAGGEKQAFYRCMSSDHNHVMACATRHSF